MTDPQLYKWYAADEAISLFGSSNDARRLCDGQWVILPKTAICLTEIGETTTHKPKHISYFRDGAEFCWIANRRYYVSNSPLAHFVPEEATAWRRHEYTIELFVRPPREGKYLYAGKLAPSYVMPYSSDGDCGMAAFRLEPTLPSSIWVQLGGIRLGDQNVATRPGACSAAAADDRARSPRHPAATRAVLARPDPPRRWAQRCGNDEPADPAALALVVPLRREAKRDHERPKHFVCTA